MHSTEPTLENIGDYKAKGSIEKRLTVWIVILSGLLVGAIYGIRCYLWDIDRKFKCVR